MDLSQREFPYLYQRSLFFALFKTYAIPSISSLLLATGQLSSPKAASKRATDTEVLVLEILTNPPWEKRGLEALARMNWLHGRWQKAGRISDGDMLYTLSMFALEPDRWINRWEWRDVTEVERCATGVVWREVGGLMGIGFEGLERFSETKEKKGDGKGDGEKEKEESGLEWMEKMERWSEWYEETEMRYEESNEKVARHTVDLLLLNQLKVLRGLGKGFIRVLMGRRLREAMKYVFFSLFFSFQSRFCDDKRGRLTNNHPQFPRTTSIARKVPNLVPLLPPLAAPAPQPSPIRVDGSAQTQQGC